MMKVLELAPEQLDAMAESAQRAGLILDDEATKAAREYEIALDDLTDQVEGAKIMLGMELIPVLGKVATAVTQNIEQHKILNEQYKSGDIGIFERNMVGLISNVFPNLAKVMMDSETQTDNLSTATGELGAAFDDGKQKAMDLIEQGLDPAAEATEALKIKEEELKQALDDLKTIIAGPVGDAIEGFTEKSGELTDKSETLPAKTEELRGKIDELEGQDYLTEDQKEELD